MDALGFHFGLILSQTLQFVDVPMHPEIGVIAADVFFEENQSYFSTLFIKQFYILHMLLCDLSNELHDI